MAVKPLPGIIAHARQLIPPTMNPDKDQLITLLSQRFFECGLY